MIRRQVAIGKEEASAWARVARKRQNPLLQSSRVWPQMLLKLEREEEAGGEKRKETIKRSKNITGKRKKNGNQKKRHFCN